MKRLLLSATAALGLSVASVWANDYPVVVELYTSQGCSSCPAADALFAGLSGRDDVIPIALHVDYWDYIGWKDTFGSSVHSDRQRAYAAKGKRRMIYTPEIIVAGQMDIVGSKDAAKYLEDAIAKHAERPSPVSLDVRRQGGQLTIAASSSAEMSMTIHMLRVIPSATTQIERGENSGRTIEYTNIAQDWTVVGKWNGTEPLALSADVSGDGPFVVLIQRSGAGPIVAAARLD